MLHLTALEHYLATQFRTVVRAYDEAGILQRQYSKRIDLADESVYATAEPIILAAVTQEVPVVLTTRDGVCAYGTVDTGQGIYIVGPVNVTGAIVLRYTFGELSCPDELAARLMPCPLEDLLNALLLTHNLCHTELLTLPQALMFNGISEQREQNVNTDFSGLLFANRESGSHHNPYDHEQRELLSIETGDIDLLRRCWEEDYAGSFGIISRDPTRNGRYLAVVVITMATRAAIRGGILPEVAMSLGDVYMQQVDETPNPYEIGTITRSAQLALAQRVAENKSAGRQQDVNPILERCKNYVSLHLHEKLTVQEIALRLHVHPNYLSAAFKEHEGVPLYQFILNEKIELAKSLLIYSNHSFSEISSYLGFSSQSHLGKVFKSGTGMTPQAFRNRYRHETAK